MPGDGGPGPVVALHGVGGGGVGGGQLEVAVAGDVDGVAVADGGAGAQVGRPAHVDVGHDAGGVAAGQRVGPLAVGLVEK